MLIQFARGTGRQEITENLGARMKVTRPDRTKRTSPQVVVAGVAVATKKANCPEQRLRLHCYSIVDPGMIAAVCGKLVLRLIALTVDR
jgi:hypothetical protein